MLVGSLGFLYASYFPDVELEKVTIRKSQWVQTKKKNPNKSLLSLKLKDQKRGKLHEKNF